MKISSFLVGVIFLNMAGPVCGQETFQNYNRGEFNIGGDWLYWKLEEEQLEFAHKDVNTVVVTPEGGAERTINIDNIKPKFKFSNGFRIFGDYLTCDTNWRIAAIYTHIASKASNKANSLVDSLDEALFVSAQNFASLNIVFFNLSNITGRWNLSLDTIDLDLCRRFNPCDCLDLQLHLGLRGQRIDQTMKIKGLGNNSFNDVSFNSRFHGTIAAGGLEGGVLANWRVGHGFSILGHIGGSIAYARARNNSHVKTVDLLNSTTAAESLNSYLILPTLDGFLGVSYTRNFCNKEVSVHAGWEQHIILDANHFSTNCGGNLSMQGLTVGLSTKF